MEGSSRPIWGSETGRELGVRARVRKPELARQSSSLCVAHAPYAVSSHLSLECALGPTKLLLQEVSVQFRVPRGVPDVSGSPGPHSDLLGDAHSLSL